MKAYNNSDNAGIPLKVGAVETGDGKMTGLLLGESCPPHLVSALVRLSGDRVLVVWENTLRGNALKVLGSCRDCGEAMRLIRETDVSLRVVGADGEDIGTIAMPRYYFLPLTRRGRCNKISRP